MSAPAFAGSVPRVYHTFLGPLIFDAYAKDLAGRLGSLAPKRILETACGTGIVTKQIAQTLPKAAITATDLSPGMIDVGREHVGSEHGGSGARITFQAADACTLPFADASFDAIACQYGVMFFPDKVQSMREARRVLVRGGKYIFNVWDALAHNPIPRMVHEMLAARFAANPPMFLAQMPFGWSDRAEIERVTRAGGFANVTLETVQFDSVAPTAAEAARAWVEGTPLFAALTERGVTDFAPVREAVEKALGAKFGDGPCRSTMRAVVVEAW